MKTNRNVASAAEMRELLILESLQPYNVGAAWTSYSGAPFGCHIRWNSEGFGFINGTEIEAKFISAWIQAELHTAND
jgi:hypothetical protein